MKKPAIILVAVVFVICAIGVWWIAYLHKAHSTFENYYAFRGCETLIERTNTYATCKLKGGETIKIVLYEGKWYLEGDTPNNSFPFL